MKMKKKQIKSLVVVVVLAIAIAFSYYFINTQPISKQSDVVVFEVNSGDTVKLLASKLKDADIVRASWNVQLVAKTENLENIKAGKYQLDRSWSVKRILETLNTASLAIPDQVRVTLREGFWAKDIAKKMEENTTVSAEELLALWNDKTFIDEIIQTYDFLTEEIYNDQVRVLLEGYLFPETYDFYVKTTAKDITKRLLDQTQITYNALKEDFAKSSLSIHEVFVLSSVVEYEASKYEDMQKIAGVFYNRLALGMPLQSSVTVCYALYEFEDWKDCESNPNLDSPYNTYKYKGLPVGPILNPSKMALEATLNPEETDYLYFMADVYGDGTVYFAKTLSEHQANVDKYLKGR